MSKTKQPAKPKLKKPEATINQSFVDGIQSMMNGMNSATPGASEVSPLPGSQLGEERTDSQSAALVTGESAAKASEKAGRKPGTKNVKRDEVDVQVSRCKSCGSTRREPYSDAVVQIAAGTDVAGKPFTHVVARPTACKDCGQARRDISYENFPKLSADQLQAKLMTRKPRSSGKSRNNKR